jgi:hypothetical protein
MKRCRTRREVEIVKIKAQRPMGAAKQKKSGGNYGGLI